MPAADSHTRLALGRAQEVALLLESGLPDVDVFSCDRARQ